MNKNEALYTFGTGENFHLQAYLGVHFDNDKAGYYFRVWAPNAEEVYVIGDFSSWKKKNLSL